MAPVRTALVLPNGSRVDLIIPSGSGTTLKTLQELAIERAALHHSTDISPVDHVVLRLESQAGPFLHLDDKVEDVISAGETVFVVLSDSSLPAGLQNMHDESSKINSQFSDDFRLRVITPQSAHRHHEFRTIPLFENGKVFSAHSTLRDLRAAIANNLEIPLWSESPESQECNCKLAEMSCEMPHLFPDRGTKVLIVSGFSDVAWLDVFGNTYAAIVTGLRELLGDTFEDAKSVHLKGGVQIDDNWFTRLPVVSICAKSRHSSMHSTSTSSSVATSMLDLHTAEGPIETTRLDLTMKNLGLTDLVVNGVLSIYAVERRVNLTGTEKQTLGKDAMFSAASHWSLPRMTASTRGSNAFLASLRVFAHKINTKEMDTRRQNIVLKLVHDMTRYFPAVRAVRMLMDGKTLRPNECAAIVQSVAEALRDLVPLNLIENDERRYLEGTRLLLGFVLQKVGTLATEPMARADESNDKGQPYLDLFKTVDLRDVRTNEFIVDPIQTDLGLMERGCYNAFKRGGILSHPGAEDVDILSTSPDLPALRAATSNSGVAPEASYYETNTIRASLSIKDLNNDVLEELRDFSRDLRYLGMLSDRSGMNVIHPTSLKSANAPVLTLDRDGYLCVYVGRAACAPPDLDISIFRPVHGSEEAVDVNIVAQLVEPALRLREHDGTIIFELLSESLRSENAKPTELLMFCVDCSQSMGSASDFHETQEDSAAPARAEATIGDVPVAGEIDEAISLDDMRAWIADYESFDDMLGLVASAETCTRRTVAENVVDFVSLLISRELFEKGKQVSALQSSATRFMLLEIATAYEIELGSLRRLVGGLTIYKAALCDFLIVKAESWTAREAFPWTYGEPIPRREPLSPGLHHLDGTDSLSAPHEIICPISQAVFEDPVTTSDNFSYERRSIERWFQIRQSSPSTGLPLSDLTLRRNHLLHNQTVRWVAGEDILQAASQAADRSRLLSTRSVVILRLNFVTPAGTFTRNLPSTLPLSDLYKIAYRGMRGVHKSFLLHLRGSLLVSSDQQLGRCGMATGSDIVASIQPVHGDAAVPMETKSEEMCLIKVYESYSELFSYWIPRDTSHTMASIIFRSWRFKLSSLGVIQALDQEVWSVLEYGGDGVIYGQRHDHWDLLAKALNKMELRKLVASEGPYVSPSLEQGIDMGWQSSTSGEHDTRQADSVGTSPATHYRVLKVDLSRYISPEVREFERQKRLRRLTRLAVSKQVFGAFINRMIAYHYPTVIGLVSFGTSPSLSQPLTGIIENFRHAVDTLKPSGDTSLWDALALAADQLAHFGQKYPGISKRIICLSDGVDTKSARTATDVCRRLLQDKIVVDSCSIGVEDNSALRTVSFMTGGYKFVPQTLEQAVAICELEPVLSLDERPPVVRPVMGPLLTAHSFDVAGLLMDEVTQDKFPVQKPHPNIDDQFFRIDSVEKGARSIVAQSVDGNPVASTVVRQRRLLTEIRNMTANPHPSYDVYVSESNMGFWKIVMSGPAESAYASGTFVLYLHMGDDYPLSPPHARFITRIFHPNINRGGRACHSIFDRNWLVDITNKQVLDTVFGLLLVPEFTDPINTVVTLNYYWDEVAFREEVKKHIEKYALKGREELGKEILGD
ncbi:hypothetical protein GJ744_004774 [Endocarpon pusillum]|uniref:peptidylprolyl isomerase n=1 Tax=Endocarpon pusillum TaxID=364733 RepID=A0A8H7DZ26_9EURO|nr:hypothetical protein GJ744_004774 [Endocarpon pusillum]